MRVLLLSCFRISSDVQGSQEKEVSILNSFEKKIDLRCNEGELKTFHFIRLLMFFYWFR